MKRLALLALVALGWAVLRRQPTATAELLPRETFRDHQTCVPHDHVEPDPKRWERAQAAALRRLFEVDLAYASTYTEPEDGIQPPDPGLTMRLRGEA